MYITDTSFNIAFSPITGIKKEFMLKCDDLSEAFNEPTILPIPDDAPEDIPRIICQTKNGHSHMSITKSNIMFNTKYDGEYQTNWNLCREYLKAKIQYIYSLVEKLNINESMLKFAGLIIQIIFDEKTGNATTELINKFSKIKSKQFVYDYSQKITLVQNDQFFINLSIANTRLFQGVNSMEPGFLKHEQANKIGVVIDINDRYMFNLDQDYHSNKNLIFSILEQCDNVIKNLGSFLNNAEVIL